MRKILIFIMVLFCSSSFSQVTKGSWLAGGNASYFSQSYTAVGDYKTNIKALQLKPIIGYFFTNKLAGGIKAEYSWYKVKRGDYLTWKSKYLNVGPFLRYYFLNPENRFNLLAETAFQYYFQSSGYNYVSFSTGPVIFLNSSVGVECLVNYDILDPVRTSGNIQKLYLSLGLQVHLERDN